MPEILRTYSCQGTFHSVSGTDLSSSFEVNLMSDGEITLTCVTQITSEAKTLFNQQNQGDVNGGFSGLMTDQKAVVIQLLHLQSVSLKVNPITKELRWEFLSLSPVEIGSLDQSSASPVESRFGLTNFEFNGCRFTTAGNVTVLDTFESLIDGLVVRFEQLPNYPQVISTLQTSRDILVTSEAIVTCQAAELSRLNTLMYDTLALLSFASGSWVSPVYRDSLENNVIVQTILFPAKTFPFHPNDSVVDTHNLQACDTKLFLESAYAPFKSLKDSLGLNVVIEYYIQAKRSNYIELRYLIAAVAMECLSSHAPSFLNQIGAWPRHENRLSLREKLVPLLSHFNVTYVNDDLKFIRNRNKLVHEGRFPSSVVSSFSEYRKFVNFIDRVLLTMLGYRGKSYLNCLNGYARETLV